ncbi:carbamoyltransferase C-terminal domain-containing protein [Propionivibrio sp.]|uniref:carbamoyltransferase C-terminal domain-containing protein n=1 Tax=Propionivibrio sp. TaxID=2212460 RepID=UPI002610BF92|nr:carbamoyltransferase C-terminal domain-containing protein [Propionivibrio sp.]
MTILSIHTGHNSTVGLLDQGKLVGLLSEEKINNIKNSAAFPKNAITALLDECGIIPDQIEAIAIAGNEVFPSYCYDYLFHPKNKINRTSLHSVAKSLEKGILGSVMPGLFKMARKNRKSDLLTEGRSELAEHLNQSSLSGKPVIHIDHHQCHAYSAYYGLAQDDSPALVFTADGSGDQACATIWLARDKKLQRISRTPPSASLGGIYTNTTRFLGMKILEHEYKVMGLAPYCKDYHKEIYDRIFAPVINLDPENPLVFKSSVDASSFYDYLVSCAVGERFDNIAGAVQHLLEERITAWVRAAIKQTGIRNIYTGGGVFMNVKLNKRIQEMDEVEHAHFLPSCGDESNPIGAAYALAIQQGSPVKPLDNLYMGISFKRSELVKFIADERLDARYAVSEPPDIEAAIADLLAQSEVVARFSGRCEWGARSLGNRAILAHPSHLESFYTVNDLIKSRDFWMPFAPTVLDSHADQYLENYNPSKVLAPHMITAFKATTLGVEHLRAAMHQGDHTIRPQVLTEEANPEYYALLKAFHAKTGVGAVMNTSLNLHGYPLVANPKQALMTLEKSGLMHLALGPFLISKK